MTEKQYRLISLAVGMLVLNLIMFAHWTLWGRGIYFTGEIEGTFLFKIFEDTSSDLFGLKRQTSDSFAYLFWVLIYIGGCRSVWMYRTKLAAKLRVIADKI